MKIENMTLKEIREKYGDDSLIFINSGDIVSGDIVTQFIWELKDWESDELQTFCEDNCISVYVKIAFSSVPKKKYQSYEKCVHTEHCTVFGCKYGDKNCPVELGLKPASFPNQEGY